jgi:hypothetical protein
MHMTLKRMKDHTSLRALPHRYDLFGLAVASELELPLPRTSAPAAIQIVRGVVPVDGALLFQDDDPIPFACYRRGETITLAWTGVRFAVTADCVVIDADDAEMAAHLLVPAAWSVVLAARQRESLHGSAVTCDGHSAVAVLGHSGSGKTTAAQGMIARGWHLLTDDLVTFDAGLRVIPGPPWMRLLPDHDAAGRGAPDAGGKLRVHPPVSVEPVPLAAIVIMAPHHERCVRLSGTAAVAAVLQQVYNPVLTHPGQVQRRFELVHEIVARIPVYGAPPRSLSADTLIHISEEAMA